MEHPSENTGALAQPQTPLGSPAPRALPFDFRGDGMEYFKIWIVNIFLTVFTLGIYSAWATVRNNRYFYSNPTVSGQPRLSPERKRHQKPLQPHTIALLSNYERKTFF
ncbi:MAG: DUF898 family protein [Marinagarivorans sp.]|nr:DUF898 family protein [Marinagarivorans sp.]